MCVCVGVRVHTYGDQKVVLNTPELELQVVLRPMTRVLGTLVLYRRTDP